MDDNGLVTILALPGAKGSVSPLFVRQQILHCKGTYRATR